MTAAMQALRLCNRALANLSRLVSSNAKGLSAEDSATSNPTPGFDARESSQGRLAVHSTPNVALGWRISQVSFHRRSGREDCFIDVNALSSS